MLLFLIFTHFNSDCLFDKVTIMIMVAGESSSTALFHFTDRERDRNE